MALSDKKAEARADVETAKGLLLAGLGKKTEDRANAILDNALDVLNPIFGAKKVGV